MKPYRILAALCCLAISALGAGKKISDYTETLTIGDAWIYEIAVPGVTNYKVTFGAMATNIIARVPGVGSLVTNANQFGASLTLTLKSGLLLTNPVFHGSVTVPGLNITNGSVTASNFVDVTNVKFWGAVGDGVTDDTASLQAALNRAGAIYIPAGTYRTTNTLSVKSNTKLTGDGKRSVIMLNPSAGAALIYRNGLQTEDRAYSVTIRDLTVNCKSNGNNGITLASVTGGLVDNCTVISPAGYGIWVTGTDYSATTVGNQAREVTVANCIVTNVVDVGIEFLDAVACSAVANHVYVNSNGTGLLIWGGSSNCTLVGNTVVSLHAANTAKGISLYGSGSITNPTSDHVISANTVQGCNVGLNCMGQHATDNGQYIINTTFANNMVSQGTLYGCVVENAKNIHIIGNSIRAPVPVSVNLPAVWGAVHRIFVDGNTLESSGTNHTYIVQNIGGSFSRNKVTGIYPPGYAVFFAGNQSCDVSENRFYNISSSDGTKAYGIFTLDSGGHGTISNRFNGNMGLDDRGNKLTALIALTQASDYNTLSGNILNSSNYPAVVDVSTGTRNTFWLNQGTNYEASVMWGSLGIGTMTPGAKLDVSNAVGSATTIFHAGTNANNGLTVAATGDIGIGTETPTFPLHVVGATTGNGAANRNFALIDTNTAGPGFGGGIAFGGKYAVDGSTVSDFAGVQGVKENDTDGNYAGALLITTRVNGGEPAERVRISSSGSVGIGTGDPASSLDVTGQVRAASAIFTNSLVVNGVTITGSGSTQMVAAAIGTLTVTNALGVGTLNANLLNLTNALTTNQVRIGMEDLTNSAAFSPQNGDLISWNEAMKRWTNTAPQWADVVTNINVTTIGNVLLDFDVANVFKLVLRTNLTYTFTNTASLTKRAKVYFQQDLIGARTLSAYAVSGGTIQTNANMQFNTNAAALELMAVEKGMFVTNLLTEWQRGFLPQIGPALLATFSDDFNRANDDPMTINASDGVGTWTSGPGTYGDCFIDYNVLRGATGSDNMARVLTPTFTDDQSASVVLAGYGGSLLACGPAVRIKSITDGDCYFAAAASTTSISIYKVVDDGATIVDTPVGAAYTVTTLVPGDRITLTASGTTLELFINGSTQGTRTDATYTTGQPGIRMSNVTGGADSFSATDL